jgi:hypothetical protein
LSDFLTELRGEVVTAHAGLRRRGRASRALRAVIARPAPALAVVGALVAILVAVEVLRALALPEPRPMRIVDVIRIGGIPTDAVARDRSVWVADVAGKQVIRVEASTNRVVQRIAVGGAPNEVSAGRAGVWVRTAVGDAGAVRPVAGGPAARVGFGSTLAVGSTMVWAADVERPPEGIHRIDAATGRDEGVVAIPGVYGLESGGGSVWAVTVDGTVMRLDGESGEVRSRWPTAAFSSGSADPALVTDPRGAWVLRTGQGADSQALRFEGDRIVRRLPIDPAAKPVLAVAPDGLWLATQPSRSGYSALLRVDAHTGEVTARVNAGRRTIVALLAVDRRVWAVAGDGTVVVVGR